MVLYFLDRFFQSSFVFVLFQVSMEDDQHFLFLFFFRGIEKKKEIRAWPIEQFFTQCGIWLAQSLQRRTNTEKKELVLSRIQIIHCNF